MKKYIVIFFAFMLVLPALAQQQAPSNEWVKHVREVVSASAAMVFTKDQVNGAVTPEKAPLDFWKKKIFETSQKMDIPGSFTILDPNNGYQEEVVSDTVLTVSVADLSLFWGVKDGVDVTDRKFLVPTHEVGTMKILKSYTSQQDAVASKNQGSGVTPDTSITQNALAMMTVGDVQWIVKDSLFVVEMNGKEYMYQKDGSDWKLQDPEAPVTIKAGDRKKDPTFLLQGGELIASNKRNGYKFGMGNYAGFQNNYYRNALNGRPLGGGFGLPITSTAFYSSYGSPYWGGGGWGGYGGGWGVGGCYGGGFNAGLNINFGWSRGGGYVNQYYCQPNRWASGGSAVWNGYSLVPIDWVGSGMGWTSGYGGYGNYGYYDDGSCYKALPANSGDQVSDEEFVSLDKGLMDQFIQPQVIADASSNRTSESGNAKLSSKVASLQARQAEVARQASARQSNPSTEGRQTSASPGKAPVVREVAPAREGSNVRTDNVLPSRNRGLSASNGGGMRGPATVDRGSSRVNTPQTKPYQQAPVRNAPQQRGGKQPVMAQQPSRQRGNVQRGSSRVNTPQTKPYQQAPVRNAPQQRGGKQPVMAQQPSRQRGNVQRGSVGRPPVMRGAKAPAPKGAGARRR